MAAALKDTQVSVRLPNELKDQMETYAQLTGRTKSYVAMEALTEYLGWRVPQIEDLKRAVESADNGDFAEDEEVRATFARYAPATGNPKAAKAVEAKRRK